jgi:LysR family glycine cleavage system transcriptional activator
MNRCLPPLNALRAFEASARKGSFTHAAKELCVTNGAISKQTAMLESRLAVKLFLRTRQGLVLTPEGQTFYQTVRTALDLISEGTFELKHRARRQVLRLRVAPTFAMRWLVPRLAQFRATNRNIEVEICTSHEPADFLRDDVDACIQSDSLGPASRSQSVAVHSRRLFGEMLLPVCSPALLVDRKLNEPRDLRDHTLLSSLHRPSDWQRWFVSAGVSDFQTEVDFKFENSALSYQAAIDKAGICIAQWAFVEEELHNGRLIEPFKIRAHTDWSHFLIYPSDRPKPSSFKVFEHWLLREAESSRHPVER